MKYFSILVLLIFVHSTQINAQYKKENKFSIQLNIQHQDIPINLDVGELQTIHKILFRPYISSDIQYNFSQKDKKQHFLYAHVGYFYNQYNSRWLATNIAYGVRYQISKKLSIAPSLEFGVGFARDQTIQYTYENEKWIGKSTPDILTYEFIAKPRFDILYSMTQAIDIVFTMHGLIFSDEDLIAIPYYGLGVGLRYTL